MSGQNAMEYYEGRIQELRQQEAEIQSRCQQLTRWRGLIVSCAWRWPVTGGSATLRALGDIGSPVGYLPFLWCWSVSMNACWNRLHRLNCGGKSTSSKSRMRRVWTNIPIPPVVVPASAESLRATSICLAKRRSFNGCVWRRRPWVLNDYATG